MLYIIVIRLLMYRAVVWSLYVDFIWALYGEINFGVVFALWCTAT